MLVRSTLRLKLGAQLRALDSSAECPLGDGSSLSPTVLWLRPVGDSSATLFSLKLAFAGSCPYLETIHSRDAQANLPGEKVATDSLDQLGQPPLFLGAALPL
jgi:hypothetical protein